MKATSQPTHRRFRYRDSVALRRDIARLELRIPWDDDTGVLLAPITVGSRVLPNRLAVHPMEAFDADAGGAPGEMALRRYRRYAWGGAGLIWFEATAVVAAGRSNPRQFYLHEGSVAEFEKLVAAVRQAASESWGMRHNPLLILQLTHSGRWSRPDGTPRPVIVHHSPSLDRLIGIDEHHQPITDDELQVLQDRFIRAARHAAAAGFDGVDIKACHGYLCSESLAAFTRGGRYGGSFENRSRLLLETLQRVRAEVPGLMVTSRFSAYDGLRYPYGFGVDRDDPDRPDLAEPAALLAQIRGAGCAIANVSMGIPYHRPYLGRPSDRAVPGDPQSPEHPLVGVARLLEATATLQQAWPDFPLVGTGYSWLRHWFPHVGAAAVRTGGVAVVGVGRMAFAYPDFARDLMEHGALDPHKTCVACSGCTQLMRAGDSTGCVIRDTDVYLLPGTNRRRRRA
ncbi:MAG: flavin oxidoreductase/NADH oxidase [Gemmatimonadota bacterium]|nr:MAG: flavin oxidoreductase/NADH oxidase [Gemmatimonadota bacterium]